MELSLGLLLLWALVPPEAHGKEGKRGTRRRSLCLQGWAGARRESDLAEGQGAGPGLRLQGHLRGTGVSGKGGRVWGEHGRANPIRFSVAR